MGFSDNNESKDKLDTEKSLIDLIKEIPDPIQQAIYLKEKQDKLCYPGVKSGLITRTAIFPISLYLLHKQLLQTNPNTGLILCRDPHLFPVEYFRKKLRSYDGRAFTNSVRAPYTRGFSDSFHNWMTKTCCFNTNWLITNYTWRNGLGYSSHEMRHFFGNFDFNKYGLFPAGGFFSSLLIGEKIPNDVDLFLIIDSIMTEEDALSLAMRNIREFIRFLSNCQNDFKLITVYRTNRVITLVTKALIFQIILRRYSTREEVLFGFDFGPAQIGYNGTDFLLTPMAQWALITGCFIVDPELHYRPSFNGRVIKYLNRGFFGVFPFVDRKIHSLNNVIRTPSKNNDNIVYDESGFPKGSNNKLTGKITQFSCEGDSKYRQTFQLGPLEIRIIDTKKEILDPIQTFITVFLNKTAEKYSSSEYEGERDSEYSNIGLNYYNPNTIMKYNLRILAQLDQASNMIRELTVKGNVSMEEIVPWERILLKREYLIGETDLEKLALGIAEVDPIKRINTFESGCDFLLIDNEGKVVLGSTPSERYNQVKLSQYIGYNGIKSLVGTECENVSILSQRLKHYQKEYQNALQHYLYLPSIILQKVSSGTDLHATLNGTPGGMSNQEWYGNQFLIPDARLSTNPIDSNNKTNPAQSSEFQD